MNWKKIKLVCVAALLAASLAAQSPLPNPASPGKMVDLGGYRMHLQCTGKGKQTVVLSPGGGAFSFDWYLVQKQVQTFARVCSYDRPGYAWSDPGPQPLTFWQEAYELELALKLSGEKGPYILVGQSIGGLVAETFAEGFPDEFAGIVFVDAPGPDDTLGYFGKLVRVRTLAHRTIPPIQTMKTSPPIPVTDEEREEAMKYKSRKLGPLYERLPAEIQRLQMWAQMLPPKVAIAEKNDYIPEQFQLLYEIQQFGHPLGGKPLITMIGMKGASEEKIEEKTAFQTLSTDSKVIKVQDAGHEIHLEDPDAVVGAIRDVVNATLHHTRLKQ
jgi:pimeloyl-ACP methyl ester carboxylesterase